MVDKRQKIKLLVMDVDGTLTDGKIYMSAQGELFKVFNIKDGLAVHDILPQGGIVPAIITGRKSTIITKRCQELGIEHLYQGVSDKLGKLLEVVEQMGYTLSETAYIGDDINDSQCMREINRNGGLTACPADAAHEIRELSAFVSKFNGGEGAVREIVEWLAERRLNNMQE